MNEALLKACKICGEVLALEAFGKRAATKDGLQYGCRPCINEYMRGCRANNLEEYRAKRRVYVRGYRADNLEECRTKAAALARRWHTDNPHGRWTIDYRKRSSVYGFEPVIEPFTLEDIEARDGEGCAVCHAPASDLDHISPVAIGGPHNLWNVQRLCGEHHALKTRADRARIKAWRAALALAA